MMLMFNNRHISFGSPNSPVLPSLRNGNRCDPTLAYRMRRHQTEARTAPIQLWSNRTQEPDAVIFASRVRIPNRLERPESSQPFKFANQIIPTEFAHPTL